MNAMMWKRNKAKMFKNADSNPEGVWIKKSEIFV